MAIDPSKIIALNRAMSENPSPLVMVTCRCCGGELRGRYCCHCGQRAWRGRLSFWQIIQDFTSSLFHAEEGFFHTVKELSLHPGRMIRSYLDGQRAHYVSAGKYTIFVLFLGALTFSSIGHRFGWEDKVYNAIKTAEIKFGKGGKTELKTADQVINFKFTGVVESYFSAKENSYIIKSGEHVQKIPKARLFDFLRLTVPIFEHSLTKYFKITLLLWIPLISLLSCVAFRKWHWNLAEHITAQSYLFAHTVLIFTLISLLHLALPDKTVAINGVSVFVALGYYAFSFMRLVPTHALKTGLTLAATLIFSGFIFLSLAGSMLALAAVKTIDEAARMPF